MSSLDILANLATILGYCAVAAVIAAPFGVVPRAGPGRALILALRSLATSPPSSAVGAHQ